MKNVIRYQGPLIACAVVIFILSSLPQVSHLPLQHHLDKVVHALVFGILAVAARRAFVHQGSVAWLREYAATLAILFALVYGMTDEFHQQFVPGRDSSLLDLGADAFGAVAAVSIMQWRARREMSSPEAD